jgi:Ca2+-binding RTX toxin-like protein
MPKKRMSNSRFLSLVGLLVVVAVHLAPTPASALTQTTSDPTDAPSGPQGKTDLRSVTWDVGAATTSLTLSVDESTYDTDLRAELGLHVLIDTDRDGRADAEIVGTRDANGVAMDMMLRTLDRTESTADCQDLTGNGAGDQGTVASTIADGLETFAFTFETDAIPGGLSHFRWAAFGQSPGATASDGPWDYVPDAANPDPAAANPGDRRCNPAKGGLRLDVAAGIDLRATCPGYEIDIRNQVVGTAGVDTLAGTSDADIVCGLGGADTISGLGGSDVLLGGSGNDRLIGGAGGDILDGGLGNDIARGGAGPDTMTGGAGKDILDYTSSTAGVTVNLAGAVGGDGFMTASGGHAAGDRHKGFEHITGSSLVDALTGDGIRNILIGARGNDTLTGNAGDDDLFGQGGNDSFHGGSGTDLCDAVPGESTTGCER